MEMHSFFSCFLLVHFLGTELFTTMNYMYFLASELFQKNGFNQSGIPPTNNNNSFSLEEEPVAGRTVRDSFPDKLRFTRDIKFLMLCPCAEDHRADLIRGFPGCY